MKATLLLPCNSHQLIMGVHHQKFETHSNFSGKFNMKLRFQGQKNSGYCWNFDEEKLRKKKITSTCIRAASSSSPSLGGSASDYSEQLLGGQVKKKRRRIAGIDQDELQDPRLLADSDSCFCEFKGVHIHYKLSEAESGTPSTVQEELSSEVAKEDRKIGFPMILLHGFGASTFSWDQVMKPFAQITGSKVLAFDRPAFGLTSRTTNNTMPLNPYSMAFSVLATLYFIDFLSSKKAVLVGHSAGAPTAVEAYFEAPDRVAALILVAPAIVAPLSAEKAAKENQADEKNPVQESNSGSDQSPNPFVRLGQILSKLFAFIGTTVMQILKGIMDMANSLYRKALAAILRSALAVTLVRIIIDKFGIAGVKNAWYDATQVSDQVLHGYAKPLRTKNWDRALVEFTVAMLTDPQTKLKPALQKRLQEISCPVLIVTGDNDRLVPAWNAVRLSQAIPGSQLEIIKNCGHLPQEEKPDEFVSVVTNFLQGVFAGSEELCLQT